MQIKRIDLSLSKCFCKMNRYLFVIFLIYLSVTLNYCQQKEDRTDTPIRIEDFEFEEYTITMLQKRLKNGQFTIKDIVQSYLDRIEAIDKSGPQLNSVIQINPDALQIAEELDQELNSGSVRGPMYGIPVLLKDNIDTHDRMETTAGSRALKGSHPLKDSWVAKKLRDAGAVILGKANLSEWANFRGRLSTSGWSGLGGQTKNPYMLDRNPCGSSSGSGVAVSANLCMIAIGTETNGSIVCPATANGIVGIKPTVGLISRSGIIPISFTQDTPGPMARSVKDAAICLGVMVGIDSLDSKTLLSKSNYHLDYTKFLKKDGLKEKRIGLYKKSLGEHYKVDKVMYQAVEFLKSKGAEIIEIDKIFESSVHKLSLEVMLYEYKHGLNNYFASLGDETSIKSLKELIEFNKSDPVELKFFDQDYLKRAEKKGNLESKEYKDALTRMLRATREEGIDRVMDEFNLDAIIAPTGSPAWKTDLINGDSYILGSSSAAAISGYPNITVPMGFIDGLPVGISFFGRAWSEPVLLEIAYAYEAGTKHRRAPQFRKH
jgi:amidase